MVVKSVELENFRSYVKKRFELAPTTTAVVGPNGSGKTNLLESLYVLSTTKSWRARDRDLVSYNQPWYRLEVKVPASVLTMSYEVKKRERRIQWDGKATTTAEHIGKLPVVLFEPRQLALADGPPKQRRQWLDSILAVANTRYWQTLLQYRRVIRQRNALLRSHQQNLGDQIFAWDVTLVELAGHIDNARHKFVDVLNQEINSLYRALSNDKAKIKFAYADGHANPDYTSQLLAGLSNSLEQDQRQGFTSHGPHCDDLAISFNHKPIRLVASRGELRTLVLAAKLAELKYLKQATGKPPLLLCDDVLGELDQSRRQRLLRQLKGYQIVITTTSLVSLRTHLPKKYKIIKLNSKR